MTKRDPFKYFHCSPEIIRLAVMLYVRFPLSLRNVKELLRECSVEISQQAARFRCDLNDINILRLEKVGRQAHPLRHLHIANPR